MANIAHNPADEFCRRQILAKRLLIRLTNLRAQLDFIKCRLRQETFDRLFSDLACLYDLHASFLPAMRTFFNSTTN